MGGLLGCPAQRRHVVAPCCRIVSASSAFISSASSSFILCCPPPLSRTFPACSVDDSIFSVLRRSFFTFSSLVGTSRLRGRCRAPVSSLSVISFFYAHVYKLGSSIFCDYLIISQHSFHISQTTSILCGQLPLECARAKRRARSLASGRPGAVMRDPAASPMPRRPARAGKPAGCWPGPAPARSPALHQGDHGLKAARRVFGGGHGTPLPASPQRTPAFWNTPGCYSWPS